MALSKSEKKHLLNEQPKPPVALPKRSNKKLLVWSGSILVGLLVVSGIGYGIFQSMQPGIYDNFAKCLAEQEAVMYGAEFCQYSKAQKAMFGKSQSHLDYRDYTENEDVRVTPTWYINGLAYENVQSFDRLAALTGCAIS